MTVVDLTLLRWQKQANDTTYHVNTSRQDLDLDFINHAFGTEDMPWAKPLSPEQLAKTLDHSLTLGLYQEQSPAYSDEPSSPRTPSPTLEADPLSSVTYEQVGMARLITDHVTFAWLTDVYVAHEHRRYGLARWLMQCVRETLELHPAIRRVMLVTGLEYGAEFYKNTLGVENVSTEAPGLITLTKKYDSR